MHFKQLAALGNQVFAYSTCGPFTKNKERIKKFKETGDSRHIRQNKLEKTFFDMAY